MKTLKKISISLVLTLLLYSCNKNEYAPEIYDQDFSVEENSPAGTIIGILKASDQDEGQILVFEIVDGNDEEIWEIDPSRGTLLVGDPMNLDYESSTQAVIVVAVSDDHKKDPLESSALVRVSILDVNEFAPDIVSQEHSIDENPLDGEEIGLVLATDPESHQTLTYQILESENSKYVSIDSITGMLFVLDSAGFDYESSPGLIVTVSVSDDHENSLSATAEITINVNDIIEETHYVLNIQPDATSGKDALFGSIVPDNNYENSEDIHLYSWTHDGNLTVNRVVMDFDLSSIPSDAVIDGANLSLFFNVTSAYGSGHVGETGFNIQRITSDWDESTVSWNTQPTSTSINQASVNDASQPDQSFPDIDITELIQDYISDPDNSYGMLLKFIEEVPYKILLLASSDHSNENYRPKLEVHYTVME